MSSVTFSVPRTKRRKARKILDARHVSRLEKMITIAMGCGIPLLSLSLSRLGGHLLATGTVVLGIVALALCVTVLGVSLSHLAWAIGQITKSNFWASWCLAVAVDLSLVLAELIGVTGAAHEVEGLRLGLMVSVTVASMILNCWAFLRHQSAK